MKLPRIPAPGESISRAWGKEVVEYLKALTPQRSPSVVPEMRPGGTTLHTISASVSPPVRSTEVNLYVTNGTATNQVKVNSGTVMALYDTGNTEAVVPTLNGTALDAATPPEEALANGTHYVYVKASLTAGPSASTVQYRYEAARPMIIDIQTSPQADSGDSYAGTAGTAYFLLATVTVAGGVVTDIDRNWAGGNLAYIWTNMGHFWGKQ